MAHVEGRSRRRYLGALVRGGQPELLAVLLAECKFGGCIYVPLVLTAARSRSRVINYCALLRRGCAQKVDLGLCGLLALSSFSALELGCFDAKGVGAEDGGEGRLLHIISVKRSACFWTRAVRQSVGLQSVTDAVRSLTRAM